MRTIETDVLVVGAGPTGLSAAILLADHGVSAITINQYPGTAHTPRAHITNIRTMEMFRDMGIEEDIIAVSEPLSFLCNNVMVESLAGKEMARYMSYGSGADRLTDYALASPTVSQNCAQHLMEPVLRDAAVNRGADVRFNTKMTQISQEADYVEARVTDLGTKEDYLIRAKYAIGADGGRSMVASQLGFEFAGEAGLRDMVNVWMEIDLEKYTSYRPGVLYSVLKPTEEGWHNDGVFICVSPWNDWIYASPGKADVPEEQLLERIRKAVGDSSIPIRVKNISGWQVNHLYAKTFSIGRVFVAGDAAHRHPPAGGLGTNTSVQDVYNLVWKLALVLQGKAGEALLDTYHDERMPVGSHMVTRAIKSLYNQDGVATALGSNDGAAPSFEDIFADRPGAVERRTALATAIKMQDYRSNALGVELGHQYESSAVVSDGTPFPSSPDPELFYKPSTHPGTFVPHAWVEHEKQQVSTTDIVGHGKFALIVGIGECATWSAAAEKVSTELGLDIPVFSVGYRCDFDDVYGDWTRVREVGEDGAILVRPDRYIAWRCPQLPADPVAALRETMSAILAR